MFQRAAAWVSARLGRESGVVEALRPIYEAALDRLTGGRGYLRVVNGRERFYVDPRWRGLFPEVYEPSVCDYLRSHVRPGDVCLNVGAHVGVLTLCLAEWSGPEGRVWAFEPNPRARRILESHVARNGLRDRIGISEMAVGEKPGDAVFHADEVEGTSRLGTPNPDHALAPRRVDVRVTTVDAFCAAQGIQPDWMVMDIEGYEVAALRGARRTILAAAGTAGLVVELHPHLWVSAQTSRVQLEALLAELRLTAYGLQGQADPLAEPGVVVLARRSAA